VTASAANERVVLNASTFGQPLYAAIG